MAEEKKPVQEPEQEANTEPAEESAKAAEKEKKKKKSEKIPKEDYDRLQAEFDSHKQQHLRVLAEYDNFRKRSANETPFTITPFPIQSTRFCRWPIISTVHWHRKMSPQRI